MPTPRAFLRGCVYLVEFHPPNQPGVTLQKYFVCLQEGRLFERATEFVGVRITSLKENEARRKYPTHVFLSPEESNTDYGAKVICEWIHTLPKQDVIDYAYTLSDATMREINERLLIALGMVSLEDIEQE